MKFLFCVKTFGEKAINDGERFRFGFFVAHASEVKRFAPVKCIMCGFEDTAVIDSRVVEDGKSIRRRRSCPSCARRFTTYEKAEEMPLWVIKRDKSREPFERQKLINGLVKACQKRPVSLEQLENIAANVEKAAQETNEKEISAQVIGEQLMQALRSVDDVAYVRFASVYRSFRDVSEFAQELQRMQEP